LVLKAAVMLSRRSRRPRFPSEVWKLPHSAGYIEKRCHAIIVRVAKQLNRHLQRRKNDVADLYQFPTVRHGRVVAVITITHQISGSRSHYAHISTTTNSWKTGILLWHVCVQAVVVSGHIMEGRHRHHLELGRAHLQNSHHPQIRLFQGQHLFQVVTMIVRWVLSVRHGWTKQVRSTSVSTYSRPEVFLWRNKSHKIVASRSVWQRDQCQ
jgi:hypothetical protein